MRKRDTEPRYPLRRLPLETLNRQEARYSLSKPKRHYLRKVLRLEPGEMIEVFDGRGGHARASWAPANDQLQIEEWFTDEPPPALQIHLGQALSQSSRFDWVVQKATELGVASITPILSHRISVRLAEDRSAHKLDRWREIAAHACAQCGRSWFPELKSPEHLPAWVEEQRESSGLKFLLDPDGERPEVGAPDVQEAFLLIGPEGGLTEAEIELALACGFQRLRLGPRVLRTETAPVAGLTLLQYLFGDI